MLETFHRLGFILTLYVGRKTGNLSAPMPTVFSLEVIGLGEVTRSLCDYALIDRIEHALKDDHVG